MGTIDDFFNYSKFEVRNINGNTVAVEADTETLLRVQVYDAVGVSKMATISGSLLYKDGRTETLVAAPVVVAIQPNDIVYVSFTIPTAEFQTIPLYIDFTITSSSAFVYKLQYQVKG